MQDDKAIIKEYGSDKAFTILYRRYRLPIISFLYRYVREDAEDVCHDVFVKLILNMHSYTPSEDAKFSTWLFQIAKNTAITHMAQKDNPVPLDDPQAPESHRIYLNEVTEQVKDLPNKYKDALILYAFRGFSYREIAQIEDISVGTVKSRINRARTVLL